MDKISKKQYAKEYQVEFKGRHSPPPNAYNPNTSMFAGQRFDGKTMTKDQRVCPMVSKAQLQIPKVSPFSYDLQGAASSFVINRNNSSFYGGKAVRNIDVRVYAQKYK